MVDTGWEGRWRGGEVRKPARIAVLPSRTEARLLILRIKKGNPRIEIIGPGIFISGPWDNYSIIGFVTKLRDNIRPMVHNIKA
jgi:hypothetical protein